MTPKIIMVPFSGKDTELAALETAAELAKKWNAHIQVWHITPDPRGTAMSIYAVYGLGLAYMPASLLTGIEKQGRASMLKAQKKYQRFLRAARIPEAAKKNRISTGPSASFHLVDGRADQILKMEARLSDLVIVSRSYTEDEITSANIITDIVFEGGKPVLMVPAGRHAKPVGEKTMIAWNGSAQAARAVTASMPFIQSGKVWVAAESEQGKIPFSAYDLSNYLAWHGVAAKPLGSGGNEKNPALALQKKAKNLDADLIVMGAYSHSRAREMVLGGVTNHMIKKSTVPVLFAH